MTELLIIATDFQPAEDGWAAARHERLPQLELLLARARRTRLSGDWRDALATSVAPLALRQYTLAAITGAAFRGVDVPQPEHTGYWFATPLHLFAGLDSLHVHPAGPLHLNADEQQRLAGDFARVFHDSPWRLQPIGRRELLLCGPVLAADGSDPASMPGGDPASGLPRGEDAPTLRRLGSEIEMWLYEHAVNREREARGELAVTALWLWGSRVPHSTGLLPLRQPQLYGRDVYAEALAQLLRLPVRDQSAGLRMIEAVPIGIASDTVLLMEQLSQLEQQTLPAALRAVRDRTLNLHLIAGATLFSLSSWRMLQWWRAPRPWWESLS